MDEEILIAVVNIRIMVISTIIYFFVRAF